MTVFGYMRVSTDMQDYDAQRNSIQKRFNIDCWVTDMGTGKVTQPALRKLCQDVKKGDDVIVSAFDRLGRSTANVISIADAFKKKGVSVISIREGIDINSSAGNMVFQMMCSISEYESAIISARVKCGMHAAMARGIKVGAPSLREKPWFGDMLELAKSYREKGMGYKNISKILKRKHQLQFSYGAVYKYLNDPSDQSAMN